MTAETRARVPEGDPQEKEFERILALIDAQPNRRDAPATCDLPGDMDLESIHILLPDGREVRRERRFQLSGPVPVGTVLPYRAQ